MVCLKLYFSDTELKDVQVLVVRVCCNSAKTVRVIRCWYISFGLAFFTLKSRIAEEERILD